MAIKRNQPVKVCMLLEASDIHDARVRKEARSLANAGMRVKLVSLQEQGSPAVEAVDGYSINRVRVLSRRWRNRWTLGLKLTEFLIRFLVRALRSRADVYHVHHPILLLPAIVSAKLWRSKIIYDMHELHFSVQRGSVQSRLFAVYERTLIKLVDALIMSDGDSRGNAFRERHGYTGSMTYLYNFAHAADDQNAKPHDIRSALGLPPDSAIVAYTGVIYEFRGLDESIASMHHWPPNAHFVMIGTRTAGEELRLRKLAEDAGLSDRVHFFGPVPPGEVVQWLAGANLSLALIQGYWLSYRLSAPTKMFDAIMARVPQVSSDFPEIRRVVRENPVGPVGEVVNEAMPDAIGHAVSAVLSKADLYATYKQNADKLARNYYSWERQEPVLIGLYEELVHG